MTAREHADIIRAALETQKIVRDHRDERVAALAALDALVQQAEQAERAPVIQPGTRYQYAEQSLKWEATGRTEDQYLQRVWNLATDVRVLYEDLVAAEARVERLAEALVARVESAEAAETALAQAHTALREALSWAGKQTFENDVVWANVRAALSAGLPEKEPTE